MTKPTRKKRSLADGPAVRRALAESGSESKGQGSWKLLESPDSSEAREVSDLLKAFDQTQAEQSWKVIAAASNPSPQAFPKVAKARTPVASTAPVRRLPPAMGVPRPNPGSHLGVPPPLVRQPSLSRAMPPPIRRRATVATQIGVAPPPIPIDPPATHIGIQPPLPPIEPPRSRQRAARSPEQADAANQEQTAFAATQVAAPRPAELEHLSAAVAEDPVIPQYPQDQGFDPPAEALLAADAIAQPPSTARFPEFLALAQTQPATSPSQPNIADSIPPERAVPGVDDSAERAPISSDAFATTHDSLPPSMRTPLFKLPASLGRISQRKLIGIGSLVLFASVLPLVLLTTLGETQESSLQTRAEASLEATSKPREAKAPATQAPPPTKMKPKQVDSELAEADVSSVSADTKPRQSPHAQTAGTVDVPWDDLPTVKAATCDTLATRPQGPQAFLLQKAVKNAQRELIRGSVKAAHVAFCEATLLGQPSDTVLMGLSQVLLMQSDIEGALKAVDTLLERRPRDRQALQLRGDMLVRMGRIDEALADWFRAAGATRTSASLTSNLIRASRTGATEAQRAGDRSRADRMWRRVIALDSTDVDACAALASILLKHGEQGAARRWLDYAESLDPQHARVQAMKGALSG